MKRILVTGAAGFIGFHLARALKRRGDEVIGYDNFNDYYSPLLKNDRAKILKEEGIPIVLGDLSEQKTLQTLVEKHEISHIVHLAAQAGVRHSLRDPSLYLQTNILGFGNILEICRKYPSIVLTFASSSSVYGMNQSIPFSLLDRTDSPVSLYGATKKSNELMAYSYHHLFGLSITGLRYFTVYGPWGRPDMAYFSFARAILAGEPIDLYNNGDMKRDFTFIDDIIDGTVAAIDNEKPWAIYNLGSNRPISLTSFINLLEEALGKKAITRLCPMQKGDVIATFADIETSQQELGFSPKTSIEEGICHFVAWLNTYSWEQLEYIPK